MALVLCTQMVRLKCTPWLMVLLDMVFVLSVAFLFRPPFPANFRRTINTAELYGAIQALRSTSAARVAVCTDSTCVYLGATGAAFRWKARGWLNSAGSKVPDVALWEELLQEKQGRTIQWVKVPSHVGIEGNSQADLLANDGRLASLGLPHARQNSPRQVTLRFFCSP